MSDLMCILEKVKKEGIKNLLPEEQDALIEAMKNGLFTDVRSPPTIQDLLDTYNRPLTHDG
jgi:hypothetical protein